MKKIAYSIIFVMCMMLFIINYSFAADTPVYDASFDNNKGAFLQKEMQ